jgi:hypothetical protein
MLLVHVTAQPLLLHMFFVVVHVLFFMLPFVMLLLPADAAVGIIGNDFAMVL